MMLKRSLGSTSECYSSMKCECISDFFPRFSTWCEGSECGGIHNQPVSFQNATPAFEWQVEWMTREPGLDCVVICWRGKGSHYWNANQTVWETMCVFRLLVCVWTVSMRFWRCLCVFVCVCNRLLNNRWWPHCFQFSSNCFI